jgi:hypothetical protein
MSVPDAQAPRGPTEVLRKIAPRQELSLRLI